MFKNMTRAIGEEGEDPIPLDHPPVLDYSNSLIVEPTASPEDSREPLVQMPRIDTRPLPLEFLPGKAIFDKAMAGIATSRVNSHPVPDNSLSILDRTDVDILIEDGVLGVFYCNAEGTVTTLNTRLEGLIVDSRGTGVHFDRTNEITAHLSCVFIAVIIRNNLDSIPVLPPISDDRSRELRGRVDRKTRQADTELQDDRIPLLASRELLVLDGVFAILIVVVPVVGVFLPHILEVIVYGVKAFRDILRIDIIGILVHPVNLTDDIYSSVIVYLSWLAVCLLVFVARVVVSHSHSFILPSTKLKRSYYNFGRHKPDEPRGASRLGCHPSDDVER